MGWEISTKFSDGVRKPGGHLFASGVLLRTDGKPLDGNEFNFTKIGCDHDYKYDEGLHTISKGIKCRLTRAYVYDAPSGRNCFLDGSESEFDMQISLLGIVGESSWGACMTEHLDVNLHDKLVTVTYLSNGNANCNVTPYTLQLRQVPREREYRAVHY